MIDYAKLRDEAFKCPIYRKLENQYLKSTDPIYEGIGSEAVDLLEETGQYEKLEEYQTNKKEIEKFDDDNIKLRDDHMKICDHGGCKAYYEVTKEFKSWIKNLMII